MKHPTSLRICHEHVGAGERFQWCNLAAHAWCYDCDFFVCAMHLNTRHIEHRSALAGSRDPGERRLLQRRTAVPPSSQVRS